MQLPRVLIPAVPHPVQVPWWPASVFEPPLSRYWMEQQCQDHWECTVRQSLQAIAQGWAQGVLSKGPELEQICAEG